MAKRICLRSSPVITALMQGVKLDSAILENLVTYLEMVDNLEKSDPKELGTDILSYLFERSVTMGVSRDVSNLIEHVFRYVSSALA